MLNNILNYFTIVYFRLIYTYILKSLRPKLKRSYDLNTLRVDAYFNKKEKKKNVFKDNIRIRVDEALLVVSINKELPCSPV